VDGGESRVSGTSIDDMRNNLDGIELAYRTIFASAIEAADPEDAAQVGHKIDELKAMLGSRDIRRLDPEKLSAISEELVLTLQNAAPRIELERPTLEESTTQ
jgi:DNA-binding GntR family transcriptional regulator